MLFIYEARDTGKKRLTFTGVNTPVFTHMPCCFALVINNKVFYNESTDFLVCEKLGFPYGEINGIEVNSGNLGFIIRNGTGKISYPIKSGRYISGGMEIYQPILSSKSLSINEELSRALNNEYVKNNFIKNSDGLGKIFFKDFDGIAMLEENESVSIKPEKIESDLLKLYTRVKDVVFETQLELWKKFSVLEELESHAELEGVYK
jgi:hypothetical protein